MSTSIFKLLTSITEQHSEKNVPLTFTVKKYPGDQSQTWDEQNEMASVILQDLQGIFNIQYRLNENDPWQSYNGQIIYLRNYGDYVQFQNKTIPEHLQNNSDGLFQVILNNGQYNQEYDYYQNLYGYVYADGNIQSLLNYENKCYPSCFLNMFSSDGKQYLITPPKLPATILAPNCYEGMFSHCYELFEFPKLPALKMQSNCYNSMFSACYSLFAHGATDPTFEKLQLPAMELAQYCYAWMFFDDNSGAQVQANLIIQSLPAITLAPYCYCGMFQWTSITKAPELPATILAEGCYQSMFADCSNLIVAPELPATTLADYCYSYMFRSCSNLTKAPELPATTLTLQCYYGMFEGCSSLTKAPELPATTLAAQCYYGMFYYCENLTKAPELPTATLEPYCYSYMFADCVNLNYIKVGFTNWPQNGNDDELIDALNSWVLNVNEDSSSIFYCPEDLSKEYNQHNTWEYDTRYIPAGWTVQTY